MTAHHHLPATHVGIRYQHRLALGHSSGHWSQTQRLADSFDFGGEVATATTLDGLALAAWEASYTLE
jgi:hypothetical protein